MSSVSGRSSCRANSVGVRLEQKETRRQVPSTGWTVREYEHTGGTDRQHVQVVRYGVRKTILSDRLLTIHNEIDCHDRFF